ncbi:MAG: MotA/TolQ/ExbB proton channel family protein [Puniceicoccales bacterium]|jgi:biopolymer transport protein TolQ|nr:MotA/TolQ/ExbB proton channel family protein [Puniceicoccales bacterium]
MNSALFFPAGTAPFAAPLASPLLAAAESKPYTWFFEQCDNFGKAIAILLVVCSAISIATMLSKFLELGSQRRRNRGFEEKLRRTTTSIVLEVLPANPCAYECLAHAATNAYRKHRDQVLSQTNVAVCMGHVESALGREVARQIFLYERRLILLTSLVSGGPFLGLLGTVYGVMIAFGGLTDKATISQLAPGVAGALVTTTCGLLVAIPATFGYNYLITQAKMMTTELENFASSLADQIELELRDKLNRAEAAARAARRERPPAAALPAQEPPAPAQPAAHAPTASAHTVPPPNFASDPRGDFGTDRADFAADINNLP